MDLGFEEIQYKKNIPIHFGGGFIRKPFAINLGESLRELRLSYRYTQQNIADTLAINRSAYTYYETGKTQPDIATIKQLAILYNMDVDSILCNHDKIKTQRKLPKNRTQVNPKRINELSSQEKRLIAQLRVLNIKDIILFINELRQKLANLG